MQNWKPDLDEVSGPKYLAITKALARDVAAGTLAEGARLPPQRVLAEALGVNLTTVTRAYGEAHRLGLVEGSGRRGSFVRRRVANGPAPSRAEIPDTGMNAPPELSGGLVATAFRDTLKALAIRSDLSAAFHYQPSGGLPAAREAGARLLCERGIPCTDDMLLVTAGGQHALHAVVSAALRADDRVAVAPHIYPGFLALARRYGLRLRVVAVDDEGLLPDALDAACRNEAIRAVYIVPTNDNPTTATMGMARRAALAEVAGRHGLRIIEDDAYGLLPEQPLAPIASLAPERTWHIASVSKILAPGLRVAWAHAPSVGQAWRLAADIHETAIMAPPLNAAVVADWIGDGTFGRLVAAVRDEAQARQAIAAACLDPASFRAQPEGYHLWMPLPDGVDAGQIVGHLRPHGLSVVAGDAFAVEPAGTTSALRVSIGGLVSRARLERGLRLLGALTGPDATQKISLV
jgi:DNA-binding transcriptional MocR family regulator